MANLITRQVASTNATPKNDRISNSEMDNNLILENTK